MKIFSLGDYLVNCYLLFDQGTKEAIIIDAPSQVEEVLGFVGENSLKVSAVFLTHCHFDHFEGIGNIDLPFYVHPDEEEFLKKPKLNLSYFVGKAVKIFVKPILLSEGKLKLGPFDFSVIHTPGHSPGSMSFKIKDWLFCGDTLFSNSIGRTDFAYASHDLLVDSIKNKIISLPDDMKVFPGHGASTTVRRERETNPFLI